MTPDYVPDFDGLRDLFPRVTCIRSVIAWVVVAAFQTWGATWTVAPLSPTVGVICFVVLFATVLTASFSVVRQADHLPTVLVIGLMTGKTVILGIGAAETTLLMLTVVLTFLGHRTSPIHAMMHLMLFGVFSVLLLRS
ncbi:hypothetical protein N7E70_008795 [Aminobacter sp. NyZ550]|uniref:hypothetical protein n=1 Tax=Aminobacter sp. NyZ550 TaxID=2979870 RepID=UPI0021D60B90|nr:hypothetical protein [Aminobacter sp. NyZ550]WAX96923.1 hypothetical protein N7E70_008795 [Aminobacter sp. NyZ550]